ncbi:MAG: patatin-like phospholipase family protein [Saprospiraceae bacterium]|nr:patatin-like phospholipase family protein [Saprospiraceae bacterium]
MNALVISGGGSKGAFAGGVAEYLMVNRQKNYDLFVGTSTGSLLAPLLAAGEIELAKRVYTNVTQKDIFTICPFLFKKGKDGITQVSINHWGIIKMFWRKEKTFGDSHNLRYLIGKTFTQQSFDRIRRSGKEVVVSVSNLTIEELEYKSSNDCEYEDFCDWIWASASLVPFMSLVEKNGYDYGDGGFGSIIPIQEAINRGASSADVIVLYPEMHQKKNPPIRNAFNVWGRTYDYMLGQILKDDQIIGNLAALAQKVALHFYYTPRLLTEQSFIFDPVQMHAWWAEGYQLFQSEKPLNYSIVPA